MLANSEGERTTPSWVAFTDDGNRLVGAPAVSQARERPDPLPLYPAHCAPLPKASVFLWAIGYA